MSLLYRIAADGVVILHLGYVSFVVIGQLLILVGILRGWHWIRGFRFRVVHLAAIAVVVTESLLEVTCPLTTLEQFLRRQGGEATYRGDFIGNCVHDLLFFDCEPQVFRLIYALFGLLVLVTFVIAPPRRCGAKHAD
jgi:Protein of Unknown function (DUF2784)